MDMDFEDEQKRAPALSSGDPVPPSDWTGFSSTASMEAIYTAHQPALARFLRRRAPKQDLGDRSEEPTSELQSLMRISYAVFCLKKKTTLIVYPAYVTTRSPLPSRAHTNHHHPMCILS